MNFCSDCGNKVSLQTPEHDDRLRYVCSSCGAIHYQNPKVIVGALLSYKDKVLLCKRAIEPRLGKWTLPAGFMENAETTLEGARRETAEEAGVKFADGQLYRVFDIPKINQVYIFYRAELNDDNHEAGIESLEVDFFSADQIPWQDLAFPVMTDILKEYLQDRQSGNFRVRAGEPDYADFKLI